MTAPAEAAQTCPVLHGFEPYAAEQEAEVERLIIEAEQEADMLRSHPSRNQRRCVSPVKCTVCFGAAFKLGYPPIKFRNSNPGVESTMSRSPDLANAMPIGRLYSTLHQAQPITGSA